MREKKVWELMFKHFLDATIDVSILPFADKRFLKMDIFQELLNCGENKLYKKYRLFQEESYEVLKNNFKVNSLDEVYLLIEKYFPISIFHKFKDSNEYYLDYVDRLSKSFICHRDSKIALKYWSNECYEHIYDGFDDFIKVELWNTFSRHFCIDLLVVVYLINNGMNSIEYLNGYYWLISIGDKQLDQILEKGVAENHMHINAGSHFHIIWEQLMNMDDKKFKESLLLKELGKDEFKGYLSMTSIIRRMMCSYLSGNEEPTNKGFYRYKLFLENSYENNNYTDEEIRINKNICRIINSFSEGKVIDINEIDYNEIYVYLTRDYRKISEMFYVKIDTSEENIFLFESIKYLKGKKDKFYGNLFWKYITLKNIIYQGITQNNYMSGLDYFQKYFKKSSTKLKSKEEHMEICIKNQLYNNNLRKLEIRLGILSDGTEAEIKNSIYEQLLIFFNIYKKLLNDDNLSKNIPNIAVVFHFIKSKDKTFFEKCWCKEDIYKRNNFYGNLQKGYLLAIKILCQIRNNIPNLSKYIVGIDAASLENNTEPWVFAPVYQNARESTDKIYVIENKNINNVQSLGFTYHVGEDYRHILSGLRHTDEVIEHFGFHAGDRIGHGIVLGIDIDKWCEENPIIVIPRIEYLENMLWVWALGYYDVIDKNMIDHGQIERVIMTQAQIIYKNIQGITIYQLWSAYQNKFKIFEHNEEYKGSIYNTEDKETWIQDKVLCQEISKEYGAIWTIDKLTHAYQCKCYLERMYEIIHLKVNVNEVKLLKHLQIVVKNKLSKKGIVVETNPTSNLSISGIERLFKHHVTNLNDRGLEGNEKESNGLIITINSDDPSVFNTNSSNELGYIFYMLQDKGYSRNAILEWMDKVRQWGIDTSFIKENNMKKEEIEKEIDIIIDKLR